MDKIARLKELTQAVENNATETEGGQRINKEDGDALLAFINENFEVPSAEEASALLNEKRFEGLDNVDGLEPNLAALGAIRYILATRRIVINTQGREWDAFATRYQDAILR